MLNLWFLDPDGQSRRPRRDEIASILRSNQGVLWIDIQSPTPEDEQLFQDCIAQSHFPKVDDYGEYLYMVLHAVSHGKPGAEAIETAELDLFFGRNYVVSYHAVPVRGFDEVRERITRAPETCKTPVHLLHALLDAMVARYVEFIDILAGRLDAVEERIFENPDRSLLSKLFAMKKDLVAFRRVVNPQREVVHRLSRGEFPIIPPHGNLLFRDIFDHLFRVSEMADSYRDLLSGALESYLTVVSNRINDVMKTLTMLSVIILPMSLIASVYGMNFQHMPELTWAWGYPSALALMLAVGGGMFTWFRRKKWL
jgi:magnesium transporter